ncbi:enoyl-CoA hydratase/isomerase family protein [Rhodococcus fascians]|nr:enoyl-CoA hydratase/isomerase family protein [Rhodococcus fascians]MBY3999960.1 enoyl-CoA hydratase/isomerase family protein [Rhodococcus fascians]MBY4005143.1 enoyl-CoA hydratase/isomerase family protein [Rhodococcus fascians]MBY4010298.1 enoyl-CoA hydratase/isomerase family protein [Rhodococcus fascians]MBY4020341.1 enoyl-CoA hydratase/isomerase family protein [Rhodococcus fascians]
MTESVLFSVEDYVGRLTLNRPERLNAMDLPMVQSVLERMSDAAGLVEVGNLRTLVISGGGDRAFSAGADMESRRALSDAERAVHLDLIASMCREVYRFPVPVVAEIHGHCIGGGAELALSCDLLLATESSGFSLPEVKLGMVARSGGAVFARRRLSHGALAGMLLTGERVRAPEALRIGLIDRMVPNPELLAEATDKVASSIAGAGPHAVRSTKELLLSNSTLPVEESLRLGDRLHAALATTEDLREGLAALEEKRAPAFVGR